MRGVYLLRRRRATSSDECRSSCMAETEHQARRNPSPTSRSDHIWCTCETRSRCCSWWWRVSTSCRDQCSADRLPWRCPCDTRSRNSGVPWGNIACTDCSTVPWMALESCTWTPRIASTLSRRPHTSRRSDKACSHNSSLQRQISCIFIRTNEDDDDDDDDDINNTSHVPSISRGLSTHKSSLQHNANLKSYPRLWTVHLTKISAQIDSRVPVSHWRPVCAVWQLQTNVRAS